MTRLWISLFLCCTSVPDRSSFRCSRSECCWHILVCCFPSPFVFDLFIFRPWYSLSSANSCSICCSSCGVLAHTSMSSAKWKWQRYSPSIFKPLVSQVSRRNMLWRAAINSLGGTVSPCRTPLLVLILLLSLGELTSNFLVYVSFNSSMYTSS